MISGGTGEHHEARVPRAKTREPSRRRAEVYMAMVSCGPSCSRGVLQMTGIWTHYLRALPALFLPDRAKRDLVRKKLEKCSKTHQERCPMSPYYLIALLSTRSPTGVDRGTWDIFFHRAQMADFPMIYLAFGQKQLPRGFITSERHSSWL